MTTPNRSARERRPDELRTILEDHRRELVNDVQVRIRGVRTDSAKEREVLDEGELSDSDVQDDIEFSLLQMKAATLSRIDAALRRLTEGGYGHCAECGTRIASARLRALPFAARCKDCEEANEVAEQRERNSQLRGGLALFVEESR
jgi:DnaK suppressor protein